jgi:hypothetical protein
MALPTQHTVRGSEGPIAQLESRVDDVHIVFKTHLDVGFTDLAANVTETYFSRFVPAVIELARRLRESGSPDRFIWTTGSWLIYEYLERAAAPDRARLEEAIVAGDIAWHGLPFTTHSELMDASLFAFGLSLSRELDRRFVRQTIAAKMTDVPGHTRGIVPLLAAAGITFLHIGVNEASTPPDVPLVFVWQDPSAAEVMVMYQKGGYGGLVMVPGLADALLVAHTDDNHGPQSAAQVAALYRAMRERFPGAHVHASTLDAFARKLLSVKSTLPLVSQEIGDTWIHGAGTDPAKIAQFRELSRLRRRWLESGQVRPDDPAMAAFSRSLLIIPEHTWGLDVKTHLADYTNYGAAQFRAVRGQANFRHMEESWAEQRAYLRDAVEALGESREGAEARRALERLRPVPPDTAGYEQIADPSKRTEAAHFTLSIDPEHGAIAYLRDKHTGRQWASPAHLLGLWRYQTFSVEDYERFWERYVVNKRATAVWSRPDQTKPGLEAAAPKHRTWLPRMLAAFQRHDEKGYRILLDLAMPEECSTVYGCPRRLTTELYLPHDKPGVYLTAQWFGKPASRLPEALWLSFHPLVREDADWRLEKMGEWISPLAVVRNGNRRLHAVGTGVAWQGAGGRSRDVPSGLAIETLDAPLVAPGEPSLLNFTNRQPPLREGMHVNLYNNVWGTNFPMWYEDDARFRFVLR